MRRRLTALVAAAIVAVSAGVAVAGPVRLPTMSCKPAAAGARELACTVRPLRPVKVRSFDVRVLLPAGYDGTGRRLYPVVYMLHGVGDDETAWTDAARGDLARLTAACQAIFVMPDGGSGAEAGWYSDWVDESYDYETYHMVELRQQVHRTFRTQRWSGEAIAGMSMGGFGALSYAARHRGSFRAVASFSGLVDTTFGAPATGAFYEAAGQNPVSSLGTPSSRVWGPQATATARWQAHNPYHLADRLAGRAIYLSSGHGAPGGAAGDNPSKVPNYASEAYLGLLNDRLAERLTSLRIPFTDGRYAAGYHDWPYWRAAFTDSLRTVMPALRAATPGCGR